MTWVWVLTAMPCEMLPIEMKLSGVPRVYVAPLTFSSQAMPGFVT